MIRVCVTSFLFLLCFSFSTADAETYTWTDEQGTIHFTGDLGSVPAKVRNKVKRVDEMEIAQEEELSPKAPPARSQEATPQAVPFAANGELSPSGIYAGRTYDQWQKELADRESAMIVVRKRIDEIAAMLNRFAGSRDEQKKLLLEHTSLTAKFKEMKAEYYQQVEIARKAGLQINIQQ